MFIGNIYITDYARSHPSPPMTFLTATYMINAEKVTEAYHVKPFVLKATLWQFWQVFMSHFSAVGRVWVGGWLVGGWYSLCFVSALSFKPETSTRKQKNDLLPVGSIGKATHSSKKPEPTPRHVPVLTLSTDVCIFSR